VRIQTLLGSCIALTAWHPTLLVGGMCHYLLPRRATSKKKRGPIFGVDALDLMQKHLMSYDHLKQYELGLFGGSHLLNEIDIYAIGRENIDVAKYWLGENHLYLTHESLGGSMARRLKLDLQTGVIDLFSNSLQQDTL